ncbi:hypothetical protein D6C86_02211 [Aureobasidium pullulans]|uniref:Bactericidal permeability-increasing protein n=1 Tax=Aureobasidium pullulans TaxID=5580 RepID=A0A4S9Q1Q5_AURPU|nr:hypothetical protein D6C94_02605 [Aureobasidium pullulans]THZ34999.1 hypothetical protein D6C87_10096 [Aureobasidium pullulans]THZ64849.1 hypothetical protein D6C86_02211 [Aureobasidium pullulans]THZ99276.1 hypothetical protein D6C88_00595 [Aureobasidium pullulans]
MSSCLGFRKSKSDDTEPLLPQYRDDTILQRELHQKLHSYQMIRALADGYMPSNEQLIINLRSLLSSDILNPNDPNLSDSGRRLAKFSKQWLKDFIELLVHKNSEDQIQDFIWSLTQSRVRVDVQDLAHRASKAQSKAKTAAAYNSLQTVGSLLLTNSDFRIFLSDLNTVGREVFKDAAFSLSNVAEEAGKKIEPSQEEQDKLTKVGADSGPPPSGKDIGNDVADISKVVANGAAQVIQDAEQSAEEKLSGDEGQVMMNRLKQAVTKLRKRPDYNESVSTIAELLKRYAIAYSRSVEETVNALEEDVHENAEMDKAGKNFWSLLSSFGDSEEWKKLEQTFKKVVSHSEKDPEFENLMVDIGNSLQTLLTDPNFFDTAREKFDELREKSRKVGSESDLRTDIDNFLGQLQVTLVSVLNDEDVTKLMQHSLQIFRILSPLHNATNPELITDAINIFIPLLIAAVQYVPIPRLEISTPDIDLLLENLIIEPGKTVNHTSFLPYKLRVETYNDFEIRKARFRTTSTSSHMVTIKIDGISARAEEVGFWMRAHSGLFRLADEGITSFALDEKGLDIHLDVEIAKDRMESMLSLKAVRVNVHKLDYTLRKSKFSWLAWLIKPVLRPIVRKVMEKQIATAIADALHSANRELLYARERLRATRVADPNDLITFFKAVAARLTPEEDPDLYTRVGVAQPGKGVFKGKYAPGSVVKLWNEEAMRAEERIEDGSETRGWRNDVFSLLAV